MEMMMSNRSTNEGEMTDGRREQLIKTVLIKKKEFYEARRVFVNKINKVKLKYWIVEIESLFRGISYKLIHFDDAIFQLLLYVDSMRENVLSDAIEKRDELKNRFQNMNMIFPDESLVIDFSPQYERWARENCLWSNKVDSMIFLRLRKEILYYRKLFRELSSCTDWTFQQYSEREKTLSDEVLKDTSEIDRAVEDLIADPERAHSEYLSETEFIIDKYEEIFSGIKKIVTFGSK